LRFGRETSDCARYPLFLTHYSQHGILWQARGEPQYLETFRAGADPGTILSHLGLGPPRDRDLGRLDLGAMDSGRRITGGGSGYAALLAHAEGVLYGTELGSVTLKRVGHTHTYTTHKKTAKQRLMGPFPDPKGAQTFRLA